jgi:hypothetical protein
MRMGAVSAARLGGDTGRSHCTPPPDHEGNDKEDYEAHNEASFEARRAAGSHDLAVRFARRWQSAPNLSQALLSGPAEPVPSGMSHTSSFARRVTSDHRLALYGRPIRMSARLGASPGTSTCQEAVITILAMDGDDSTFAPMRPREILAPRGHSQTRP